jgi:conjugal transfer pilus assembly protein TraF
MLSGSLFFLFLAATVSAQQGVAPMAPGQESYPVPQAPGIRVAPLPVIPEEAPPPEEPLEKGKPFYEDYKRGWYWYEKEKPKAPEQKEEPPPHRLPSLKDYAPDALWNMHPDDFQTLLMDFQKKAVMAPTEANVKEYYFIQDIARRKSLTFANVTATVMQKYPELSVAKDYPVTTPGRNALTRQEHDEITRKIKDVRGSYALLFFHSPTCPYCVEQEAILRFFEDRYGWEVKKVDITEETALASMFNVTTVPTILLVYRYGQEPIVISAGVVSLDDMEQRLYRGIRLLAGEITPDEYSLYEFQRGGAFDVNAPLTRERSQ